MDTYVCTISEFIASGRAPSIIVPITISYGNENVDGNTDTNLRFIINGDVDTDHGDFDSKNLVIADPGLLACPASNDLLVSPGTWQLHNCGSRISMASFSMSFIISRT